MLDKLMRLPVIPEGAYPQINESGMLVDAGGTLGQPPICDCLSIVEIEAILERSRDGLTIRPEILRRKCDDSDVDKSQDGWYKIRVSVHCILLPDDVLEKRGLEIPTELQHLFRRRGPVVLAKAGVIGPSLEAIEKYLESL